MTRMALLLALVVSGCTVFDPKAPPTAMDYFIADTARLLGHHDPLGPRWNYGEHHHYDHGDRHR